MPKVLHISRNSSTGGASIAASRLNEAMQRSGIDSSMLVLDDLIGSGRMNRIRYSVGLFIQYKLSGLYKAIGAFSCMDYGLPVADRKEVADADIIIVHWVSLSMLSIRSLEALFSLNKPVYWFLHDMCPMTGGCHYSLGCEKYRNQCNDCVLLKRKSLLPDMARIQHCRKYRAWHDLKNPSIISPSHWLAECARDSSIFSDRKVYVCSNLIDTDVFRPASKAMAKGRWSVGAGKRTILFCAENVHSVYKGWSDLLACLNLLDPEKYNCLVMGGSIVHQDLGISLEIVYTGLLSTTEDIIMAYNAADVFVTPTLADNYPNVLVEALACGVPCVSYDSGGVGDLVKHKRTGYLARRCDPTDLAAGIEWVFDDSERYGELSGNARSFAEENLSYRNVRTIYKDVIG